jgi:hypothetical protein
MEQWLSPEQVLEIVPGLSREGLAMLRFNGTGPRYSKPSPRKVVYSRTAIDEWLKANERNSTKDFDPRFVGPSGLS